MRIHLRDLVVRWLFAAMERRIVQRIEEMEYRMAHSLEDLVTQVQAQTGVEQSLITLTTGLKNRLDAALAGTLNADQQAKIDSIFDGLAANNTAMVDAIQANAPPATQ